MRDTLKFVIQVAIIVFVGWFLVKFTTIDDSIISFFRANSTTMTGNVAYIPSNEGDIIAGNGVSCTTPWGETLNHGTYIIAYESTNSCRYEKRFCNNGYLEGTYTADHCNSPEGIIQKTVVKPVISKIAYGYVQGAAQSNYSSPILTNGNGTVTIINSWNNTKGNPTTISANDSNYKQPTSYKNYDLTQHGCTTPWGSYIDSSEWVIAYKSSKPAYAGASCTYERRTCFQGTLGGSYIYPTCTLANNNNIYNNHGQDYYYPTPTTNRSCITPWGQSVSNGSRVYAYRSSSSSSYSCQGEYRTCRNGYLDGSYQYSSCNNYDNGCHNGNCGGHDYGRSCSLPWGGSVADGSSVTAYNNSSAPCSSERRTCRNGYLEGSYQYSSCNNTPTYSSCSLPWGGSIQNGQTVEAYQNSSAPCYKEVRTCYNGSLGGSFQYASCNPGGTNPTGGSDTYGSWQSAGDKEGNVDSLDTCNSNATSPYTCGSESSNSCTDYQKVNCTSFSPMICSYQTRSVSCVK